MKSLNLRVRAWNKEERIRDMVEKIQKNLPEERDIQTDSPAGPSRLGYFLSFSLVAALLGLLGWGLIRVQNGPVQRGKAPDFTLTSFEGETLTLSELRGQVVVINFWASWCPPCREEAAYLEQTWREYKDRGVVFIGVDYVDTEEEALAYIEEFNITYFNGPDTGTRISQAYNIQGVPETFYVGKDGDLRGVKVGPLQPPELENKIESLLAEPYSGSSLEKDRP